ncbi:MAG TPA: hypothetical protein VKB54_04580 [Solirubrobacteraceae bacterium]|nr:hypothetical protein [Solirubrobacteraceae bacterium]
MADDDKQTSEEVAWDRVGQFLGDMSAVAGSVWSRNLTLWSSVSANIRKPGYDADAMAKDAAKAMVTAIDNVDDIWSSLTRPLERQKVATPIPTAFLYFDWQEGSGPRGEGAGHSLVDPVWILVPSHELKDLPDQAKIDLSRPKAEADAVKDCLEVSKQEPKGYLLQAAAVKELTAGTYSGAVYLTAPRPRVLANLRVVVQEKPTRPRAGGRSRSASRSTRPKR